MAEPIRVFIVDDHLVVRRGLASFLEALSDIELVGEAADGVVSLSELAMLAARDALPDVILMDLVMPKMDGVTAVGKIIARYPRIKVVAMTSFSEPERVHAALAAGACGYVLKDADADEVAAAIHAAHAGEVHLDSAVARVLTRAFVTGRDDPTTLSACEREIITLVAQGLSNKEIARRLVISERTARTHVSNILLKLGLTSRTQAALWAIKEGFISA
jgi:DNA-binding NarL/FixJ family response regulator